MKILIVAPAKNLAQTEIPFVSSGNRPTILSGMVTIDHLETALCAGRFDVVHFAQHGSYGVLQMSDGMLNDDQLVRALQPQVPGLRLVVINACNSAGIAARIHNDLRVATIAHEAPIDDRLAVVYARELYKALHSAPDLHAADDAAFRALEVEAKMNGITGYARPILVNGDMTALHTLEKAVADLQQEQADLRRIVAELVRWVRVAVPATLALITLLVLLAYLAPGG